MSNTQQLKFLRSGKIGLIAYLFLTLSGGCKFDCHNYYMTQEERGKFAMVNQTYSPDYFVYPDTCYPAYSTLKIMSVKEFKQNDIDSIYFKIAPKRFKNSRFSKMTVIDSNDRFVHQQHLNAFNEIIISKNGD